MVFLSKLYILIHSQDLTEQFLFQLFQPLYTFIRKCFCFVCDCWIARVIIADNVILKNDLTFRQNIASIALRARFSSVVKAFAYGAILHGVDPLSYFSYQLVLHDWCNKGRGMYYPVCGMMLIKEPLLLIGKITAAGFLSRYLNGSLPYVRHHITVNKMCWVHRLLKHFFRLYYIWNIVNYLFNYIICVSMFI